MNPFGMYLTTLRLKHKFKQKDLAEALNEYSRYISEIESGRRNPPSSKVIDTIASVMSLSRDEVAQLNSYAEQSITVFHVPGDLALEAMYLFRDKVLGPIYPQFCSEYVLLFDLIREVGRSLVSVMGDLASRGIRSVDADWDQ